tara:strand:- start:7518 stop:9884 length:2367 start_codon:yes stop_codon:yes gene_type:complete
MIKGLKITLPLALLINILAFGQSSVSFIVLDKSSSEPLFNCLINSNKLNGLTNEEGFIFLNNLNKGDSICLYHLGYHDTCFSFRNDFDTVALRVRSAILLEVDVMPDSIGGVHLLSQNDPGKIVLRNKDLTGLALLGGENDIIKGLQFYPGVQGGNPGSSNLHIRGGGHYQNRYILDGIPVYNLVHLTGITSPFPSAGIRSVSLFKQNIPTELNDGSSGIIELYSNSGIPEGSKGSLSLGIGTIGGNLAFGFNKKKSSLHTSFRASNLGLASYIASVFNPGDELYTGFEDFLMSFNHKPSTKGSFKFTTYFSRDYSFEGQGFEKNENAQAEISTKNYNYALGLNHQLRVNDSTLVKQNIYVSSFNMAHKDEVEDFQFFSTFQPGSYFDYSSSQSDYGYNLIVNCFESGEVRKKFGLSINGFQYIAPSFNYRNNSLENFIDTSFSGESSFIPTAALYYESKIKVSTNTFLKLGGRLQYNYFDGISKVNLLPRISLTHGIKEYLRAFIAYDELTQNFHRIRQGVLLGYQDLSVPASSRLPIERTKQISLGASYTRSKFNFNTQVYYRQLINYADLDYTYPSYYQSINYLPEGNVLSDVGANLISVDGSSFGLESGLELKYKGLKALISYGWSKSSRISSQLNNGNSYPYNFNREHNFRANFNYRIGRNSLNKIFLFGISWFWGSGFQTQFPYYYILTPSLPGWNSTPTPFISERHSAKLPPVHHLDLAFSSIRETKSGIRTLTLSIYNAYLNDIANSYVWYPTSSDQPAQLQVESLTPFFPSLSFSYEWK